MKKNLIYFVCILFLGGGCTGDTVNPLMVDGTCSDNILNQDEEKTDCGGVCPSCEDSTVSPCKALLTNNTVQIDGVSYPIREYDISSNQNYGYPEIYIYNSELSMTISIPAFPETPAVFQLKSIFSLDNETAGMRIFDPGVYNALRGKLYISRESNAWLIEFCEIELTGNNKTIKASGRIIYR
jgi:hypothetical protein